MHHNVAHMYLSIVYRLTHYLACFRVFRKRGIILDIEHVTWSHIEIMHSNHCPLPPQERGGGGLLRPQSGNTCP